MKKKKIRKKKFRSKLEKYCYEKLKEAEISFEYEPKKFVLVDKFRYPGISLEVIGKQKAYKQQREGVSAMTYTPDFVGDHWIIETKGHRTPQFNLKWKLFKKHLLENALDYDLYMPTNQKLVNETIKLIIENDKTRRRSPKRN